MSARTGVLLINLGTPDSPAAADVRRYLREFLMDPYVVDIAWPLRWLLVNGLILRKRPADSAALYRKIWTDRGSPLLFHLLDLVQAVQARLGGAFVVRPGMRYGSPSIGSALEAFKADGVDRIVAFPLYPQYSLAATESSVQETRFAARALGVAAPIEFVPDFHDAPWFIDAFAEVARPALSEGEWDHVLFSFHGLPERQVKRTDPTGAHCRAEGSCCDAIAGPAAPNAKCYRAQCFATARLLAGRLGLRPDAWSVSFQSRLGRTPWIRPYTDVVYDELAARGAKRIAVLSPAFVADCLETLEEIAIRGHDQFRARGGELVRLVPSLNAHPKWVDAVAERIRASRA
jgi:ferrochelatase